MDASLTFLARGFEFKGTLRFEGGVRIDGIVVGEIQTGGTLILGQHARIEGSVRAATVISGGRIVGDVAATEKVRLISTAALFGSVKAPLLQMEEGVLFEGTCETEGIQAASLDGAGESSLARAEQIEGIEDL